MAGGLGRRGRTASRRTRRASATRRTRTRRRPGAYRIAVLGDSFVFGSGVAQDAILTRRLAAHLGPGFEIVNLGVPGYGTDQELLTLRRWGRKLAPDLVLLGFFWNDIMENVERPDLRPAEAALHARGRPPRPAPARRLLGAVDVRAPRRVPREPLAPVVAPPERALVGRPDRGRPARGAPRFDRLLAEEPARVARGGVRARVRAPRSRPRRGRRRSARRSASSPCRRASSSSRAVGARLLKVYGLPEDAFEEDGFRRLREACEARGIPFVDLLPGFRREAAEGARLFLPTGIHWSAAGHDAAARHLAPAVRAGLLARQRPIPGPGGPAGACGAWFINVCSVNRHSL